MRHANSTHKIHTISKKRHAMPLEELRQKAEATAGAEQSGGTVPGDAVLSLVPVQDPADEG